MVHWAPTLGFVEDLDTSKHKGESHLKVLKWKGDGMAKLRSAEGA